MKWGFGMGVTSLVLGIVSIVLVCLSFIKGVGVVGVILGLIGIILGASARKSGYGRVGVATAGMVCSIVGMSLCLTMYIACVTCFDSFDIFDPYGMRGYSYY